MIAVVQRVSRASVRVEGKIHGAIERGLLILLGVARGDGEAEASWLAKKCAELRIFSDSEDKMNLGLAEVGGSALVVSQFTLLGECVKGRRPSFTEAAPPAEAVPLYELFVRELRARSLHVETGVFQAMMEVELLNDGPVTLILDSRSAKTGASRASGAGPTPE